MTLKIANFNVVGIDGIVIDPSVKFKTTYALVKIGNSNTIRLKYLHERYEWFNYHSFGNALDTSPTILVTDDKKTLGSYNPGTKVLRFSKFMFVLKHDADVLGTMAHEMAHKYVVEVLRYAGPDPHGKEWQGTMHRIGLPANAGYAGNDVDLLPSKQQKNIQIQKDSNLKISNADFLDVHQVLKLTKPRIGIYTDRNGKLEYAAYLPMVSTYGFDRIPVFLEKYMFSAVPTYVRTDSFRKTLDIKKVNPEFFSARFLDHYKNVAKLMHFRLTKEIV